MVAPRPTPLGVYDGIDYKGIPYRFINAQPINNTKASSRFTKT